jgi:hypothetical protein
VTGMAALTADVSSAVDPGVRGPVRLGTAGPAADRSPAAVRPGRTIRSWPLLVLAAPAAAEVWSGWVGIAQKTGFGLVSPLPGIWPSLHLDTAITLPVGVEAYAAYALRAWLAGEHAVSGRTRRFARWSAVFSRSAWPGRSPTACSPRPGRRRRRGRSPPSCPACRSWSWPWAPRWRTCSAPTPAAETARIISDRANISSPAGQTALVTLYAQLAMLGLAIDLDFPAARPAADQPPLRGSDLLYGLLDYSADLLPGGSAHPSPIPDVTFALGDTPAPPAAIRVSGTEWTAAVGTLALARCWQGNWPAGAMAAAAAAAAEGLRAAVPRIADRAGRPVPTDPRWRTISSRQVVLDLGRYRADGPIRLGAVDVISGGAITNAALYALLRMPAVTAAMRIIEPDLLDLPNLNRYALARRSMRGWPKTRALVAFQTLGIAITGREQVFNDTTAARLAPIARSPQRGVQQPPPGTCWGKGVRCQPGQVCQRRFPRRRARAGRPCRSATGGGDGGGLAVPGDGDRGECRRGGELVQGGQPVSPGPGPAAAAGAGGRQLVQGGVLAQPGGPGHGGRQLLQLAPGAGGIGHHADAAAG